MISKEEIKRLADLARIEVADEEATNLAGEIDAILGYVGQVKSIQGFHPEEVRPKGENDEGSKMELRNVFREDENPTESGKFSKELIAEFPESEKDYLKVKKIL